MAEKLRLLLQYLSESSRNIINGFLLKIVLIYRDETYQTDIRAIKHYLPLQDKSLIGGISYLSGLTQMQCTSLNIAV